MRPLPLVLAAALVVSSAAFARAARAEEIVLASGGSYEATDVTILEKDVRFTYFVGGGRATVVFPMGRIEARSLLALLVSRTKPSDAAGQLKIARLALARGLVTDAAARFRRAAELDPALAKDRDDGLQAIRDAETEGILKAAEQDVRIGRNDLAALKAKEALARALAGSPLAARATGILEMAVRFADRDRDRAKAEAAAKTASVAAAEKAAFEGALASADKAVASALARRAKAADPDLSQAEALRALESAETSLRDARRSLAGARDRAGARVAEVDGRDAGALALLVATHLDLADLYRQEGRFDRAHDRVRAALLLDPQSTRAQQTQDRIEADLRAPAPPPYDPDALYPSGFVYSETYGFPYVSRYATPYAPRCGCGSSLGFGGSFHTTWRHGGLWFGW